MPRVRILNVRALAAARWRETIFRALSAVFSPADHRRRFVPTFSFCPLYDVRAAIEGNARDGF